MAPGLALLVMALACARPTPPGPASIDAADKVLRSATSADGRAWLADPGVLAEGGSSPCLATVGGRPRVYFVQDGRSLRRVDLGGGPTLPVSVSGAASGIQVDPHVVPLARGYRLYYIQASGGDPGGAVDNEVHSAWSPDGEAWEREPGVRWTGGFVDPDVVALPEGGWRMYLTIEGRAVVSLRSPDGLAFAEERGCRLEGVGVTSTIRWGEAWWMFGHGSTQWPPRIYRASSPDGLEFTLESAPLLENAESPSVLRVGTGWRMAFSTPPSLPAP